MQSRHRITTTCFLIGAVLTALTATACGTHNSPELDIHRPSPNTTPAANRPGGACTLHTTAQITRILHATAAHPHPDTFTPGTNRCDYTLTGSPLGNHLTLTIEITTTPTHHQHRAHTHYTPATHTLTTPLNARHQATYQITTGTHLNTSRVHRALVTLATQQ